MVLLSNRVGLLSNGVGLLSNGVGLLSNGVGLLSNGVGLFSNGVGLLSNGVGLKWGGPTFEWGRPIFEREGSRKYAHPLFEQPLTFIAHGCIFERLRYSHLFMPNTRLAEHIVCWTSVRNA